MTQLSATWLSDPTSVAVMAALGRGYFVGGCVRNALLGLDTKTDVDIATPLRPTAVIELLEAAGLKAVPTGLSHGTITAVCAGVPIEVTTFRADVATDGRHAEVAFTTDISTDAARRDFTMNALYAERDGTVIDPLGGLPDLEARQVRFIGLAEDRIREDYLRILRFFRFHAWYGADGIDAEGLAACAALADGLEALARERVGWEFRKLLAAPDPARAVASMAASGILARCLPGATPSALAPLVHLERENGSKPQWLTRLRALGSDDHADRLRLSRAEIAQLARINAALDASQPAALLSYRFGGDAAKAASLITAASSGGDVPPNLDFEIARGAKAVFPVQAKDLMRAGLEAGPKLGAALARAEAIWLGQGFQPGKDALVKAVTQG
ncbi:MAG: CCA tRNA nucleotidyltransferase [Paracoccaceae bacterium]